MLNPKCSNTLAYAKPFLSINFMQKANPRKLGMAIIYDL
jgi:hypothetical protein